MQRAKQPPRSATTPPEPAWRKQRGERLTRPGEVSPVSRLLSCCVAEGKGRQSRCLAGLSVDGGRRTTQHLRLPLQRAGGGGGRGGGGQCTVVCDGRPRGLQKQAGLGFFFFFFAPLARALSLLPLASERREAGDDAPPHTEGGSRKALIEMVYI